MPFAFVSQDGTTNYFPNFSRYCPLGSTELKEIIDKNNSKITEKNRDFSLRKRREYILRFTPLRVEGRYEPFGYIVRAIPLGDKKRTGKVLEKHSYRALRKIEEVLGNIARSHHSKGDLNYET
jgi:hypothetical protein